MNERRRHPEEMTTFEYLDEELFQSALKGSFQREFNLVKVRLPELERFATPKEFMHAVRSDSQLRTKLIEALEKLWQADYDLRPASGIVLMLAQWVRAPAAGADYWFDYFVKLEKAPTNIGTSGCPPGRTIRTGNPSHWGGTAG